MKSCEMIDVGWTASRGAAVGASLAAVTLRSPVTMMVSMGEVWASAVPGMTIAAADRSNCEMRSEGNLPRAVFIIVPL